MLTADNITEDRILDLLRLGEDSEADAALKALRSPRRFFNGLGVGDEHMARQAEDQRKARAWCAALLNTRIKERRCRECNSLCDHKEWDGLRCPWCRNTGRIVVQQPVCSTCNDTHSMELRGRPVACTRCPTPCQACSEGGTRAFCASTPCACDCHVQAGKRRAK